MADITNTEVTRAVRAKKRIVPGAEDARRAPRPVVDIPEEAARLRLAITRTARRLRQSAGATELGASTVAALATVERHGPMTPSELADVERIKRPTTTRIVARLADEGLIERA